MSRRNWTREKTVKSPRSQPAPSDKLAESSAARGGHSAACTALQARLYDYLDGEMSAAEAAAFRAHLESCEACRQEASLAQQSERALTEALRTLPPAGDLHQAFQARLSAETTRAARRQRIGWSLAVPALAAASLLLLFRAPLQQSADTTKSETKGDPVQIATNTAPPSMAKIPPFAEERTSDTAANATASAKPPRQRQRRAEAQWAFARRRRSTSGTPFAIASAQTGRRTPHRFSKTRRQESRAPIQVALFNRGESRPTDWAMSADSRIPALQQRFDGDFRYKSDFGEAETPQKTAALAEENRAFYATSLAARTQVKASIEQQVRLLRSPGARTALLSAQTPQKAAVSLRVVDEERNFVATARVASEAREDTQGEAITIHADSEPGTTAKATP